jgi:hypothetical protein
MLELKFENKRIDHVFLISGQPVTPILIGLNFRMAQELVIDFASWKFTFNVDGEALELDSACATKEDNVSRIGNLECRQVSEVGHLPTPQPTVIQTAADPLPTPLDIKFCAEYPNLSRCSSNSRENEDQFLCFMDSSSQDKDEDSYRLVECGQFRNVLHIRECLVQGNSENSAGDIVDNCVEVMNVEARRHAAHSSHDREPDQLLEPNQNLMVFTEEDSFGNHAVTTVKRRAFFGFGKR